MHLHRTAKSVLCALLLAACAPKDAPKTLSLAETYPLPASGITRVGEVKITPGGREHWKEWLGVGDGDAYLLTAAATPQHSEHDLMAVLWCAARHYAQNNGYAAWRPRQFSVTSTSAADQPHIAHAMVEMFRNDLPEGVLTLDKQKDWCLEVPPQASSAFSK